MLRSFLKGLAFGAGVEVGHFLLRWGLRVAALIGAWLVLISQ